MPLFQRNREPILFHLINLEDTERAALTELIESEGGGVTDDDNFTVKFTSRDAYVRHGPLVRAKTYDVTFIKECIRQKKIVRPEDYRLDKQIGRDDFYVHHFLYGKCQDARYPVRCQCGRRQEETVRTESVYGMDTLADSDASIEQATSITHESTDESQQVLSALDLEGYAPFLAGGDSAARHDNGKKRPCNLEYELKFKPKEAFQRIEDCATKNADSRLNGVREDCPNSSRNWYENPDRPSKMESVANVKQELDDDWTNMDMRGQVAVLSIIPEARMLAHDTTVVPPATSQNDHWIRSTNETTSNAQRNDESTDRETETPDLDLVPATNNHPKTVRMPDHGGEPMDTERKHRIEKYRERSHASIEKPKQCRRKKSENTEVDGDRERNLSTDAHGAKKAHRRLPNFRESQRVDDVSEVSSISSSEATNASQEIIDDTAATISSESEIISDGNSGDDRRSRLYRRVNAKFAGPSSVRNTRRGHVADERESNEGKSLVRNIAHPSFLTNPIEVDDDIEEPEAQSCVAKKTSRGKEWRAKLKSETDAQYTGTKSRIPFTSSERRTMLRYLIKNKSINRAKGLVVWKEMITDGHLTDRTPQSLQNHFRKCILPNIEHAGWLENSDMQKFLALRGDNNQT